MKNKLSCTVDILIFLFFFTIYLTYSILIPVYQPNFYSLNTEEKEVNVVRGMSAKKIALKIKEAGLIKDSNLLVQWMARLKIDKTIRPGKYFLHKGHEMNIAYELQKAKPLVEQYMLIPGSKYESLVKTFLKNDMDFFTKEILNDDNFPNNIVKLLPQNPQDRIAFLLPETYSVLIDDETARSFIKEASRLWVEKVGIKIPKDYTKKRVNEVAVLASIVEGEAKLDEERPILSGIFLNRIKKNIKLQSCATVIFSWDKKGIKKDHLTYKDLEINTPYNTYINYGLPPGPICVPSLKSWMSALNPEYTDYLFFFANSEGKHVFSNTYKEHLEKQKILQKDQ